ncbi:putative protein N(5)-glutamine methyltransferase [Nocardioides sp. GXZ039]|uniref:putative protein N(5)-glutamine methyltransferase n=1 Tax=Nocardioides sp. GXZ039 TaxID=3136018 RepID=UPI0030F427A8
MSIDDVVRRLRAAGCVFAEQEATLLVEAADDDAHLRRLVSARSAGRPLEHLLGWAEFDGLRIVVADGVFVPRQRTRLLVEVAAARAPRGGVAVDLCCGSGALLVALAARRPDLEGHAADLDPAAVACARQNLPPECVHAGDLFDALPARLRGRIDVVVANAPYVPTEAIAAMPAEARDHEHRIALDGGTDGLDLHRRVAAHAARWLGPGGLLVIEVAPAQLVAAASLLSTAGFDVETVTDDERDATAVLATLTRARNAR